MIVTVFGLFPIAVQTIRGLEAVPQFYSDVVLTCGATRTWTLWHVLRVAARQIYGGIRTCRLHLRHRRHRGIPRRAQGFGIWLQAAYNSFRTPLIFSATLVIIVITGVLMCLVNLSERLLLDQPVMMRTRTPNSDASITIPRISLSRSKSTSDRPV